jgi:hypothetical protein
VRIQKAEHAFPGELAGISIVYLGTLLVEKAVLDFITKQFIGHTSLFDRVVKGSDCRRGTPIVLVGKMTLEWYGDADGISNLSGRNAIKANTGIETWELDRGDNGQRTAHAKAHDRRFAAIGFDVFDRAANVLLDGPRPIQPTHQMAGFICIFRYASFVEIRCERIETRGGQTIAYATDLLVEPLPLLKDNDVFGATSRPGQITCDPAAIGGGEMYRLAHNDAPLVSM